MTKIIYSGRGEPNIPEHPDIEYDAVVKMQPPSETAKIKITSIEQAEPRFVL